MRYTILLIILLLFSFSVRSQNVGRLDPTFGTGGVVETQLSGFAASLNTMVIQPDKKIIVVGYAMIARFNEDGTLDTTFNGVGYNTSNIMTMINDVAVLPNGKIMVGGYIQFQASNRFCIARLNSNGSLDTTFDTDGIVETTVGYASNVESIKILPDGKILAVGGTALTNGGDRDVAIARYSTDGSLDTTFGTGGRVAADFGFDEFALTSAIQSDGKIVAAGYYVDPLPNEWVAVIFRFNSDGSVDSTFGTNGKVSRPGGPNAQADDVAIQSDGKIIVVGGGIPPIRYNSDGTLDAVFTAPSLTSTWALRIQPDGKIIIRGTNAANNDVVVRYNIDGTPESSFAIVTTNLNYYFPPAISIAPDGKIVVGGTRNSNNFEILLARYRDFSNNLMDFDGDGKSDVSIYRPGTGEWWYSKSSDGQSFVAQFGTATDTIVPGDFTGDGKSDFAFYRPSTGLWFILRSEDFSFYAFPLGNSSDVPAPADYDGDGKTDAAVYRPSTNTWYINNSTGGTTITTFGNVGDIPVVADYDGDGKADIAIFRPSSGEWWIQQSGGTTVAVNFGISSDKCVPGDYTGDGKADVAFWRPSTGEWFVLRSEDNSYFAFPFGVSTDIPTPADYDGDGKMDAAVFRPSTSTWYVDRSTSGLFIQEFGSAGDIPLPSAFIR
ncbi:MAG TPA: FG-GAP-like repeat-containing protein [Pyrinomonadaceae bacterium]|nr:VCBS repeat-containing protein [Chloracidobacterium sp.]MBP9935141.1 VCBS repeat-containing protein [Pyrinomonadaceae bacterium]MBK7803432.1 VCBS repeat-containing protein [Chloracidobacterium sp.]MBK9438681.1 VCBS repeat-containing protein [Chloracidobacterium sp.]MBL0241208.1 VCBS repeat-containing protein [Chloracidobacterium sp.]